MPFWRLFSVQLELIPNKRKRFIVKLQFTFESKFSVESEVYYPLHTHNLLGYFHHFHVWWIVLFGCIIDHWLNWFCLSFRFGRTQHENRWNHAVAQSLSVTRRIVSRRDDRWCLSNFRRLVYNLRLLKFIRCSDFDEHRKMAPVLSACKRLEVFGYMHDNRLRQKYGRAEPAERLWTESPTIKHLNITDFEIGWMDTHLPTPGDTKKLFTLELKGERGCIYWNLRELATSNAPLVKLVLQIPEPTEKFDEIAMYLHDWTNLLSYCLYTGFQLSDEIVAFSPNLKYVGRSECPREYSITYNKFKPQYIYKYEWTKKHKERFQKRLFRRFQAWKGKMKDLKLRV